VALARAFFTACVNVVTVTLVENLAITRSLIERMVETQPLSLERIAETRPRHPKIAARRLQKRGAAILAGPPGDPATVPAGFTWPAKEISIPSVPLSVRPTRLAVYRGDIGLHGWACKHDFHRSKLFSLSIATFLRSGLLSPASTWDKRHVHALG